MTRYGDADDPKGVIADAYRIDGITRSECRSIFLDWALSVSGDARAILPRLLDGHGAAHPDHPMTAVLREGLVDIPSGGRRGGRGARHQA